MTTYFSTNGVTPTPVLPSLMATNGYVLKPGCTTLYTHLHYPGFLFKLVEDVESALSCGGICLMASTGSNIMYFGSTFMNNAIAGKLGSYVKPSRFKVASGAQRSLDQGGTTDDYRYDTAVVADGYQEVTVGTGPVPYFAVVTKATAGFMLDILSNDLLGWGDIYNATSRSPEGVSAVQAEAVQSATAIVTQTAQPRIKTRLPTVSGFMSYEWNVPKKKWVIDAKPGLLATITEPTVKTAYAAAVDEVASAIPADALVTDGVRFIFGWNAVAAEVQMSSGPRQRVDFVPVAWDSPMVVFKRLSIPAPYNSLPLTKVNVSGAVDVRMIYPQEVELAAGEGPYIGAVVPGVAIKNADSFSAGNGFPDILVNPLLTWMGSGLTGLNGNTSPWFSPREVPYKAFILAGTVEVPSSGVFAAVLPISSPSSEDVGSLGVLDLRGRVTTENTAVRATPAAVTIPTGATNTAVSVIMVKAQASVVMERALARAAFPFMTPFARFVVSTQVDIDEKAEELT